jgi:ubiquinone/menaquinone biosynthesis C-methylase UbiE
MNSNYFMDVRNAYDIWASQYDGNDNQTRDLEGHALRVMVGNFSFDRILEIGCGTGKNTAWFVERAKQVTAVDFSDEMLARAKQKTTSAKVDFKTADITLPWTFTDKQYDLISFSLVLEHIHDLSHIFREVSKSLTAGGLVYIGELHPFKQYSGTKARFETDKGLQVVECFAHHISDFTQAAKTSGLTVIDLNEFFDHDDRSGIPRILTLILRKFPT